MYARYDFAQDFVKTDRYSDLITRSAGIVLKRPKSDPIAQHCVEHLTRFRDVPSDHAVPVGQILPKRPPPVRHIHSCDWRCCVAELLQLQSDGPPFVVRSGQTLKNHWYSPSASSGFGQVQELYIERSQSRLKSLSLRRLRAVPRLLKQ